MDRNTEVPFFDSQCRNTIAISHYCSAAQPQWKQVFRLAFSMHIINAVSYQDVCVVLLFYFIRDV